RDRRQRRRRPSGAEERQGDRRDLRSAARGGGAPVVTDRGAAGRPQRDQARGLTRRPRGPSLRSEASMARSIPWIKWLLYGVYAVAGAVSLMLATPAGLELLGQSVDSLTFLPARVLTL